MKSILLHVFIILVLVSCAKESSTVDLNPNNGNTNQISQSDYDALIVPCANESNTIAIPEVLTVMSNYIQYEATTEIALAFDLSKSLLMSLNFALLPPATAIYSDVDNITVFADSKSYEWKVGADTYRYTLNTNGYEIRFFENSELIGTGRVLVHTEQTDNCSEFEYTQYAIEDNGDEMIGDIVFRYTYQTAGTSTLIKFGTDLYSPFSEEYEMRTFNDLSGDMFVKINNESVRNYNWQSNGNGSYNILEDGFVVDSGTWSF